jgi:hypothetical protein
MKLPGTSLTHTMAVLCRGSLPVELQQEPMSIVTLFWAASITAQQAADNAAIPL